MSLEVSNAIEVQPADGSNSSYSWEGSSKGLMVVTRVIKRENFSFSNGSIECGR
jgi:hypothetical protein